MGSAINTHSAVCLTLTRAISGTRTVDEIYAAALDALAVGLRVERSSILLFDPDGVMRFKACRGLSAGYRAAVEGHTPWTPDSIDPQPIVVSDVTMDAALEPYRDVIDAERIAALTFIPLVSRDRVIGKFMLYYPAPYAPSADELQLARVIAATFPWFNASSTSSKPVVSRAAGVVVDDGASTRFSPDPARTVRLSRSTVTGSVGSASVSSIRPRRSGPPARQAVPTCPSSP